MFSSVNRVGGVQPDVGAYANVLAAAGIVGPFGTPISEALTFGCTGGIGFLYGVFVYGDQPTMTIVGRNTSMPDTLVAPVARRIGIDVAVATTGGAKLAKRQLDAAVASERPALCHIASILAHQCLSGGAPALVGVVGVEGDVLLIDDRAPTPHRIERQQFDAARAGNRAAKHLMITVPDGQRVDWEQVLPGVVAEGVRGYNTPPVPQFASNIGLAGLAKLETLLTARRGAKSWVSIFSAGPQAAFGLTRLVDCLTYDYASEGNSRLLYADFLDEVAGYIDGATAAAGAFRDAAVLWTELAALARQADPEIEAACACSDRLDELLRSSEYDRAAMQAVAADKQAHIAACALTAEAVAEVYAELGLIVGRIIAIEATGLELLASSSKG